jgi:hypothetical protein
MDPPVTFNSTEDEREREKKRRDEDFWNTLTNSSMDIQSGNLVSSQPQTYYSYDKVGSVEVEGYSNDKYDWVEHQADESQNGGNPPVLYAGIGGTFRPNDLNTLSAMLYSAETSLFTLDAHAEYQLARNAAQRSSTFFKSGLNASDDLLRTIKIGATALGKVTYVAGVAISIAGVIQNPTGKNLGWAVADIGVGTIGLFSGSIATGLATAGLAIPGLNVIIAGATLGYAGYRLYQAYNDGN